MSEQVDITVSHVFTIHFLNTVSKQTAVQTDEVRLGKFSNQSSNILMLNIGIGIILGTSSSICSLAIVRKELHLFKYFTVFSMALTIKHETLGHLVIAFAHQCLFHLILNIFHLDTLVHIQMTEDFGNATQVNRFINTVECFDDGIHDFVKAKTVGCTVSFGD